ncbi:hypothetical protein EV122DRAFT_294690 [Schizophyllum commune]
MVAPDLDEYKIFRSGPLFETNERKVYVFLKATKSLRHVTISWSFVYKDGLRDYLQSDAAKNLVSLRLEASGASKITNDLWRGLCGEEHNLPQLQQLTLRNITGLTPKTLWGMLRNQGRIIPRDIVNSARQLDIHIVDY